jgi:hypothetical protein
MAELGKRPPTTSGSEPAHLISPERRHLPTCWPAARPHPGSMSDRGAAAERESGDATKELTERSRTRPRGSGFWDRATSRLNVDEARRRP